MSVIRWEDPPRHGKGHTSVPHEAIAAALKREPGRWGRVLDLNGDGWTLAIKSGRLRAYRPAGSFEVVTRNGEVYARYVGEGGA